MGAVAAAGAAAAGIAAVAAGMAAAAGVEAQLAWAVAAMVAANVRGPRNLQTSGSGRLSAHEQGAGPARACGIAHARVCVRVLRACVAA